jgi:hypothetical protein
MQVVTTEIAEHREQLVVGQLGEKVATAGLAS